jgi:hypothetical protein
MPARKKTKEKAPILSLEPPQKFRPPVSHREALTNMSNWRKIARPVMGNNFLRGFYIPHDDLLEVRRNHPDARGVRAYFSILDQNTIASIHLYIVPVDERGKDILIPAKDNDGKYYESTVYDFTQPCPNQCDFESPYYDPKEGE